MKLDELKASVSPTVRKLNPDLFPALGGLGSGIPQPTPPQALDGSSPQRSGGKASVSGSRESQSSAPGLPKRPGGCQALAVHLTAYRRRLLDDDNHVASLKPLRDAVAAWLGIDDGDARVRWEYGQVETRGRQGVAVRIGGVANLEA